MAAQTFLYSPHPTTPSEMHSNQLIAKGQLGVGWGKRNGEEWGGGDSGNSSYTQKGGGGGWVGNGSGSHTICQHATRWLIY